MKYNIRIIFTNYACCWSFERTLGTGMVRGGA